MLSVRFHSMRLCVGKECEWRWAKKKYNKLSRRDGWEKEQKRKKYIKSQKWEQNQLVPTQNESRTNEMEKQSENEPKKCRECMCAPVCINRLPWMIAVSAFICDIHIRCNSIYFASIRIKSRLGNVWSSTLGYYCTLVHTHNWFLST